MVYGEQQSVMMVKEDDQMYIIKSILVEVFSINKSRIQNSTYL